MARRHGEQRVATAFGNVLRAAREHCELTQERLAEELGCDRSYPSLLERGYRCPTLVMILRLAPVLRVDAAVLVDRSVQEIKRLEG